MNGPVKKWRIALKFFGPIVGIIGKSTDELLVEREKVTVRELVLEICEKYGKKFEEMALTDNGDLNTGLIIFVNGIHTIDQTYEIFPTKGDEIQIMIASQMKGG